MEKNESLKPGDVVQLSPTYPSQIFASCMMTVTEIKPWGAQGYVQGLGKDGKPVGQAYIRPKWEDMEYVGKAVWVAGGLEEEGEEKKKEAQG